jgi:formylglycine-generating enzyme required for sulfatase activity
MRSWATRRFVNLPLILCLAVLILAPAMAFAYNPPGMSLIPAGCFNMGDAFSEGHSDELPVHNVCITSDFYMDVHEVTNAEYAACVSGGGCMAPFFSYSYNHVSYYGNPTYNNFPVIYNDYNESTAYCTWEGKRLPTEAEWEYAARGGLAGKRYPWGDTISGAKANYDNSGDPWDNDTTPVGYYAANGYGLYDMAGNVGEWVSDWYLATYYSVSPTNNPTGPASGTYRVVRGAKGFPVYMFDIRVASRGQYFLPTNQYYTVGFRCAGDEGFACEDLDGDGRGDGCVPGLDCDDLDPNNWNSCATCADTDSDSWFAGCDDYVTISGPDCNNNNARTWNTC